MQRNFVELVLVRDNGVGVLLGVVDAVGILWGLRNAASMKQVLVARRTQRRLLFANGIGWMGPIQDPLGVSSCGTNGCRGALDTSITTVAAAVVVVDNHETRVVGDLEKIRNV